MGINTIPIEKLASLAKFYDTSIDYLVGLTDERKPYPKNKWVFNKSIGLFYFVLYDRFNMYHLPNFSNWLLCWNDI